MCCTRLGENAGRKNSPFWHHRTTLSGYKTISSQLRHVSIIGKNPLNTDTFSTCPHNVVSFDLLMAEICWWVWGIRANFNGFRVLAALLHGTLVVGVKGATCIRLGWATITLCISPHSSSFYLLSFFFFPRLFSAVAGWMFTILLQLRRTYEE